MNLHSKNPSGPATTALINLIRSTDEDIPAHVLSLATRGIIWKLENLNPKSLEPSVYTIKNYPVLNTTYLLADYDKQSTHTHCDLMQNTSSPLHSASLHTSATLISLCTFSGFFSIHCDRIFSPTESDTAINFHPFAFLNFRVIPQSFVDASSSVSELLY